MWNWFTILITILITHDFRTTKKPSKYWAFTAGDEGLEPPSTVLETGALPLN